MTIATVLVLPGDGIGPEVTESAVAVLECVRELNNLAIEVAQGLIGAAALNAGFGPLPEETRAAALRSKAVFLGAVGHPSADAEPANRRPEAGLLALREALGVYANLRPVVVHPALVDASVLRAEHVAGTNILVVRELLGGAYFGTPRGRVGDMAFDTMRYTRPEVERIAHVAFTAAQKRGRRVLSVDKANVLDSSRLWREVVTEVAVAYPDVALEHGYVDSVAMRLVADPRSIDVLVTENLFGDILSDEAGVLVGSLGLLPSASLGDGPGLFEPVHGSAPTLAGRGIANPVGAIRSMAMLLRHGLLREDIAQQIDTAVDEVLSAGARTADLGGSVSTREFTQLVLSHLEASQHA